jgi:hypothetical protein
LFQRAVELRAEHAPSVLQNVLQAVLRRVLGIESLNEVPTGALGVLGTLGRVLRAIALGRNRRRCCQKKK